jgi:hypothetical protein
VSAQTELPGLIQIVRETPGLGSLQAAYFIRDHGPSIAELIEAVAAEAACEEALRNRWRPRDRDGKEAYDADRDALRESIKRKAAALRKLTEPKA